MAEYIDRELLEPDTEWDEYEDGFISYSQSQIERMEPADVIERSKINKAIEEIENEVKFWDCPVNYREPLEVQRNKQAKANSYRHALELLKRNIGE